MNAMARQRFLQQYAQTGIETAVVNATPHRLIQMLFEGVLDRLAQAKGAIARKDYASKAKLTNRVIEIIDSLRASLDMEKGGEIADNLAALYDFMIRRVFQASARNDVEILDEVAELVREVKSGWDEMPSEYRHLTAEELQRMRAQS